jgi:cytochrome c551/c552
MAENVNEALEKKAPETPQPDPIADRSLSMPILLSVLALVAVMLWSMYDEVIGQRPWKSYQNDFVSRYATFLERVKTRQGRTEREIKGTPEYQELQAQFEEANNKAKDRLKEIEARTRTINLQLDELTPTFQDTRAWIAAKTFNLENTPESDRQSIRDAISNKRKEKVTVTYHDDAGKEQKAPMDFTELETKYNSLNEEKAKLATELVELNKPVNLAKEKRDTYLQDNLVGLNSQQVASLEDKVNKFEFKIKQIHVAEGDLVDRCESCHLGIREPLTIKPINLRNEDREIDDRSKAFASHPNPDLLKVHDPERFGCSVCHGGNGRGTVSVERAHGRYKHWLWPLYYKENTQAGCNQCHKADRVTQMATVLNDGKQLFQVRGCTGCHRYEGYDRETDALSNARQQIKQLELDREAKLREIKETNAAADNATDEAETQRLRNRAGVEVPQLISELDARIAEYERQSKYLMQDQKKVGPNLKEIKAKLKKDWIPGWLRDPQAFRPQTKMPSFRLEEDEIQALSAYIWQKALDVKVQTQGQGDANNGRELFRSIGCLACHTIDGAAIGAGTGTVGGHFAANLSRVGEKANYDYIVRWIYNPRIRIAPYSPSAKKDLLPEDYRKAGKAFVFDDDNSRSPVDGRELQIHNMTVMPNFRLTESEARDIATFIFSLKKNESYPAASFMDNKELAAKGERLAKTYGCAGCHEISGLEEEQRIGTELTPEGSKPIERLDFALLTEPAMRGEDPYTGEEVKRADGSTSWYNHKGFFENKLKNPGIYDQGKEKAPEERLKMPNIYLEKSDIDALTTFLLGSVESALPASMRYNPTGQKQAVQNGWWVVQKYNCMGCHNVLIGQPETAISTVPIYAGQAELLPPRLTTEGARVNPEWLLKFLRDPSLASGDANAVRQAMAAHLTGQPAATPASVKPAPAGAKPAAPAAKPTAPAANPPAVQPAQTSAATEPAWMLGRQWGASRNGVRSYLKVRMPTFHFSQNELQALVNFFMGASSQQMPFMPEPLDPMTGDEQTMARAMFSSQAAPCLKCHMTGDAAHDAKATAPNFLIAKERLKPAWTRRWIIEPQIISPGTAMPSGLFERDPIPEHDRWIMKGVTSPQIQTYNKDHADLLVRYMFQITPDEQGRLKASGSSGGAAPAAPAPAGTQPAATTKAAATNGTRKLSQSGAGR